ncbi:MAG: hypothetical protein ACLU00_08410 [Mediterraneibacter faecis]
MSSLSHRCAGVANAKNLWRWGLGGLAHYSNGYDGPADGVALTMDGKIDRKDGYMANSIVAESIDAGYRTRVRRRSLKVKRLRRSAQISP